MLRDDEDNFTLRLLAFFREIKSGTFAIKVSFKGPNDSSWQRLDGETPIQGRATLEGVSAVVDQVERLVTDKMGGNPFGTLRLVGYQAGKATQPHVDMQRTLIPAENGTLGEPNVILLKAELHAERTRNAHLTTTILAAFQAQSQLNASLAASLQASATMRTASSTGGDLAGLSAVLGLGAALIFAPVIKKALGLPPDASIAEVTSRLQALAMNAVEGAGQPPRPEPTRARDVPDRGAVPPESAIGLRLPGPVEVEPAGDVVEPEPVASQPLDELLRTAFNRATDDPDGLRRFMADHPDIVARLMRL